MCVFDELTRPPCTQCSMDSSDGKVPTCTSQGSLDRVPLGFLKSYEDLFLKSYNFLGLIKDSFKRGDLI